MSEYATAAGDKFFIARAPNLRGGAHLELFDLDEAIRLLPTHRSAMKPVYI